MSPSTSPAGPSFTLDLYVPPRAWPVFSRCAFTIAAGAGRPDLFLICQRKRLREDRAIIAAESIVGGKHGREHLLHGHDVSASPQGV